MEAPTSQLLWGWGHQVSSREASRSPGAGPAKTCSRGVGQLRLPCCGNQLQTLHQASALLVGKIHADTHTRRDSPTRGDRPQCRPVGHVVLYELFTKHGSSLRPPPPHTISQGPAASCHKSSKHSALPVGQALRAPCGHETAQPSGLSCEDITVNPTSLTKVVQLTCGRAGV